MSASDVSSRLDWSLGSSYDYTAKLTPPGWAWEFLRRNPEFQIAWWQSCDAFEITFSDSNLTIIHARSNAPTLEHWGCLYTDATDIDAHSARVFWLPSHMPAILSMHGLPLNASVPATPLALRDLASPCAMLHTPDGVQHVLLHGAGHSIHLAISGASMLEPAHLLANTSLGTADARQQLVALGRFNDFIAGVPASPSAEQLGSRLRQVLQALDGSLAGASHRAIAPSRHRAIAPSLSRCSTPNVSKPTGMIRVRICAIACVVSSTGGGT